MCLSVLVYLVPCTQNDLHDHNIKIKLSFIIPKNQNLMFSEENTKNVFVTLSEEIFIKYNTEINKHMHSYLVSLKNKEMKFNIKEYYISLIRLTTLKIHSINY